MAVTSQRFFTNPPFNGVIKPSVFVDLGDHNGDSLLRGIAAGIVDKMLRKEHVSSSVINEVVTRYLARFPEDRKISTKVNPTERLQQLTRHLRLGQLTQKIAYILGQIIADEFSKNEEYAHLVVNGDLSPSAIIDEEGLDAIIALSTALPDLPLEILIVEPNKPLFKRASFNTTKQNPDSIVLQENNGYYQPRLVSNAFDAVVLLPVSKLNHVADSKETQSNNTITITEQERAISAFEDVYRPLCAMVTAGELDADDLTEIYVKSTTENSKSASRQRFRADIFEGVIAAESGLHRNNLSSGPVQFAKYLAGTISKAVGLGQINKDDVFNLVDAAQKTGIRAR